MNRNKLDERGEKDLEDPEDLLTELTGGGNDDGHCPISTGDRGLEGPQTLCEWNDICEGLAAPCLCPDEHVPLAKDCRNRHLLDLGSSSHSKTFCMLD